MRIEEKDGSLVIVDFDELEAYKIARAIESEGARFYSALASKADDAAVRKALELLAFQEKDHLDFFDGELRRLRERREDAFEEDDLLAVIDYGIFQPYRSMADLAEALDNPRNALRLGLIVEEKSIQFYEACRPRVSSPETREEIDRIIGEERSHKRTIEDLLAGLAAS